MLEQIKTICLIDLGYFLFNYFSKKKYKNTTRWFYLHSITNYFIVYNSLPDIINCIINATE